MISHHAKIKNYWEKNDSIKALMKKQGLKNMEEVQSYFEKRLEKIVASKGKQHLIEVKKVMTD